MGVGILSHHDLAGSSQAGAGVVGAAHIHTGSGGLTIEHPAMNVEPTGVVVGVDGYAVHIGGLSEGQLKRLLVRSADGVLDEVDRCLCKPYVAVLDHEEPQVTLALARNGEVSVAVGIGNLRRATLVACEHTHNIVGVVARLSVLALGAEQLEGIALVALKLRALPFHRDRFLENLLSSCNVLIINTPRKRRQPKETNWKQKFQKPQNENICLTSVNTGMNGNFHSLSFGVAK